MRLATSPHLSFYPAHPPVSTVSLANLAFFFGPLAGPPAGRRHRGVLPCVRFAGRTAGPQLAVGSWQLVFRIWYLRIEILHIEISVVFQK